MDPKVASVVSNVLRNVFKTRLPDPHLPALEPKSLLSFKQVAKQPFPNLLRKGPAELVPDQIHPDALEHQLARNHDEAWGTWAESGDETATHQVAKEQALNAAKREMDYPALQVREDPTRSARKAMNAAFLRHQARDGQKPAVIPAQEAEPRILPPQPRLEQLGNEPPTTGSFVSRYLNPAGSRPQFNPAQRLMRFLQAKPGTPGFDHSTPAQNLLQLGAQKTPWGALGIGGSVAGASTAAPAPRQ